MENETWVKLYRKFESWEWYTKPNMAHFFIWLLLRASHKDRKFRGMELKTGQLVFGRKMASKATGLSEKQIRTCISLLKQTGEVAVQRASNFSIISILNYQDYQEKRASEGASKRAKEGPEEGHIQEYKNIRRKEILTHTQRASFDVFYKAYPKKRAVADAERAWAKIDPSEDLLKEMLLALEGARGSEDWKKENGRYIPLPASWLNGRRWEDKLEPEKKGYDIWKTKPVTIPK